PPPDLSPRLQAAQIGGKRGRRHAEQGGEPCRRDGLKSLDRARNCEVVRVQLQARHRLGQEVVAQLAEDEEPEENVPAATARIGAHKLRSRSIVLRGRTIKEGLVV